MQISILKNNDILPVPVSMYGLQSRTEFFLIVAYDFGIDYRDYKIQIDGFDLPVFFLGKLSELDFMNKKRLQMTLLSDGWDWITFPDPEVILLNNHDRLIYLNFATTAVK